jgi:Methyltransferase domain
MPQGFPPHHPPVPPVRRDGGPWHFAIHIAAPTTGEGSATFTTMLNEPATSLTESPQEPQSVPPEVDYRLGPLSWLARWGKLRYFLPRIDVNAQVLDIGCADNWFKRAAAEKGITGVTGLDLRPPADIVGDVMKWQELGLQPHSFDVIVAFEVFEHGPFAETAWDLLRPDGQLMLTTPLPQMDGACKVLERLHMLQQRTSPHSHLCDVRKLSSFEVVDRRIKAGISQWGVLRPRLQRGA